jgi:hypothetical protein
VRGFIPAQKPFLVCSIEEGEGSREGLSRIITRNSAQQLHLVRLCTHSARSSTSHFPRALEGIVIDAQDRFHGRRPWSREPVPQPRPGCVFVFLLFDSNPGRLVLVDYAPDWQDVAQDHDSLDARSDDRGLGTCDRYPFFRGSAILVRASILLS